MKYWYLILIVCFASITGYSQNDTLTMATSGEGDLFGKSFNIVKGQKGRYKIVRHGDYDCTYGIIDTISNKLILPPVFSEIRQTAVTEDDNTEKIWLVKNLEKSGVFNVKRGFILPLEYQSVYELQAYYSSTKVIYVSKKDNKYQVWNGNFQTLVPGEYSGCQLLAYRYLKLQRNELCELFDSQTQKMLFPLRYKDLRTTAKFDKLIASLDDGDIVIDFQGETKFNKRYKFLTELSNGYYQTVTNGLMGIVDSLGNVVVPIKYKSFDGYANYYIAKHENGKVGIISKMGYKTIVPIDYVERYSHWETFTESFRKENNTCDFYEIHQDSVGDAFKIITHDCNKKLVLVNKKENRYLKPSLRKPRKYMCAVNGKYGIIDSERQILLPFEYDALEYDYNNTEDFKYKNIITIKNGKYGLLSDDLKVILDNGFEHIERDNLGFMVTKNGKKGIMGTDLKMIIPINYAQVARFAGKLYWLNENEKWGLYSVVDQKYLIAPRFKVISEISSSQSSHIIFTIDENTVNTLVEIDNEGKIMREVKY